MSDRDDLQARLDDMEVKFAFQQETLDSLGGVVTKQWAELDRISKMLGLMQDRLHSIEDNLPEMLNQRPPHY